jgi:hypothetical protein
MSAPRSIRTAVAVLAVFAGALALTSPAALAAPPEAPETVSPATGITATGATLHGVLNPGGPSEGGGYRFTYKQSASECEPEGTFRPESPALALGKAKEEVSVAITGLEPAREYTFCVIASNLSAETATGAPVTFKTLGLPPVVDGETETVGSTSVTLQAQVNPNNQATRFVFEYATEATGEKLEGTIVTVPGAEPLPAQLGDAAASIPRVEGLTSGKTYFYRVVAENARSEEESLPVEGPVHSFTTVPVPTTEPAAAVTATTAVFHGHLTPLNAVDTEYWFDYRVGSECTGEGSTPPADAGTGSGSVAVSSEASGLQPSATYSVCLVSSNAFGSEPDPASPAVSFTTPPAPPKVDGESTSSLTPVSATLEALVNANNETTTYTLEYADEEAKLGTPAATVFKGEIGGYGDQGVSAAMETVLTANTTYYYRVIAENEQSKTEGKPVQGAIASFKTPPAEPPKIEPGSEQAVGVGAYSATFEVKVDPENLEATIVFEYATSEPELLAGNGIKVSAGSIPAVGFYWEGISASAFGLQPATHYYFRVAATNIGGTTYGPVATFSTLLVPLVEETLPEAIEITPRTAVITNITINPQMEEPPEEPREEPTYYILYGTTEAYDQASPAPTHPGAGYGLTGKGVPPIALSGLAPGTTYHYAVVAHNANGTQTSRDRQFTTSGAPPLTAPPAIGVASAQFVNETSAIINGEINPEGQPAAYEIQYGATTAYGSSTPPAEIAPFTTQQGTITALTGLQSGTAYHYRLVASSQAGTSYGPDETFTTTGAVQTGTFAPFAVPSVPPVAIAPFTFPPEEAVAKGGHKRLTKRQKLAAALKACSKQRRGKRASCERKARRRYRA